MKLSRPIPIQPYLKKYLSNLHPIEPFVLTEKNRFGAFLINSLRFKTLVELGNLRKMKIRYQTALLEVELPYWYWRDYGTVITAQGQVRFNNFLMDEFKDRLMDYVAGKIKRKGDLNIMLINFREKYGICEDELSLKTLQKMYERESKCVSSCKSA